MVFFFFNDTATTEIYTLSLHDALPICGNAVGRAVRRPVHHVHPGAGRSEEHTSELQSRLHLVCRLLLEKKKKIGICVLSLISTTSSPFIYTPYSPCVYYLTHEPCTLMS